ncbi:AraC family transcriptional regulator [uncultured Draconibacterium sp.]|uniref:AraC family transcriptional regulator n=1 Tax=uncultured Draconibacterium sp. TaxID=1573823 RepID=UPI0025F76395|nr:AraC family transcriptional regulator [uncultured Draconibacterium sp.]
MEVKRENTALSAERENITISNHSSFYVGTYRDSYFRRSWHYHPEYELLLITKGYGTRMVGDHFESFKKGDLVLLGGNLPHAWISDQYFKKDTVADSCESVFIQFRKSVFGTHFIDMPEMASIRIVLKKAERGLRITGEYEELIKSSMLALRNQSPLEQLLTLIRMLDLIQKGDYEMLASDNYSQQGVFKSEKMTMAHNFIMQNFKHDISVNDCAETIGMTTPSFCRFFKKQTNVTFSVYLNYLRINLAQKLLRQTVMPVKEIAFECGFVSIVYFNQKFKTLTGMSPGDYRKRGRLS